MKQAIVKLAIGFWTAMHPGHAPQGDAPVIADAIAVSTLEDAARGLPPVLGSYDEDVAAMAYWADKESNVRLSPGHWVDPKTRRAVDPVAQGPWQTHRLPYGATALEYARDFRRQMRDGKKVCPESPLAPLSGSCHLARPLADRRSHESRRLLIVTLGAMPTALDGAVTSEP